MSSDSRLSGCFSHFALPFRPVFLLTHKNFTVDEKSLPRVSLGCGRYSACGGIRIKKWQHFVKLLLPITFFLFVFALCFFCYRRSPLLLQFPLCAASGSHFVFVLIDEREFYALWSLCGGRALLLIGLFPWMQSGQRKWSAVSCHYERDFTSWIAQFCK